MNFGYCFHTSFPVNETVSSTCGEIGAGIVANKLNGQTIAASKSVKLGKNSSLKHN